MSSRGLGTLLGATLLVTGCTIALDPGGYEVCEGWTREVRIVERYEGARSCEATTVDCARDCATNADPAACAFFCILGDLDCAACGANELQRCMQTEGCRCPEAARTSCREDNGCDATGTCPNCAAEDGVYSECLRGIFAPCIDYVAGTCQVP